MPISKLIIRLIISRPKTKPAAAILFTLAAVFVLAAGCGASSAQSDEPPADLQPIRGPVSEDGLQAILATPDLGIGRHRVAFTLVSQDGLVDAPSAAVQSFYAPTGDPTKSEFDEQPTQTALAIFRPFPLVERGIYSTRLTFDRAGQWSIRATTLGSDGAARQASIQFQVAESTQTPAVGDPAIPSRNRTAADVERLSQLTTGSLRDADLYRLTIADAIANAAEDRKPTVVVIASPAFCINAVCGPQVDVLAQLADEYAGRANFIHIDYYDNPEEIQGDLSRARVSQAVLEWRLPSAEWTFIIDADGIVAGRFEGFAPIDELRQALKKTL